MPASLAGIPGLSVPAGFTTGGLPVGIQLLARSFDEQSLYRAGHAWQQLTAHHRATPPLSPPSA